MISKTPKPPYYAVIFTSLKRDDDSGYQEMANKMLNLASEQSGFLGVESARNIIGITVSYWRDLESIRLWKLNAEHIIAQDFGKNLWYKEYKVRICLVERDYEF